MHHPHHSINIDHSIVIDPSRLVLLLLRRQLLPPASAAGFRRWLPPLASAASFLRQLLPPAFAASFEWRLTARALFLSRTIGNEPALHCALLLHMALGREVPRAIGVRDCGGGSAGCGGASPFVPAVRRLPDEGRQRRAP